MVSPAMRPSLWISHSLTAGRSVIFPSSSLLSSLATSAIRHPTPPPYFHRVLKGHQQHPSGKTTKIKNHCSPSPFHSSFFSRLWNELPHSLQSHSSLQIFKTAVHHHFLSSPTNRKLDVFKDVIKNTYNRYEELMCDVFESVV